MKPPQKPSDPPKESSSPFFINSSTTSSPRSEILQYIIKNSQGKGVNLPVLLPLYCKFLRLDPEKVSKDPKLKHSIYMQLYRLMLRLEKEGFITIEKYDGMLWITPTPYLAIDPAIALDSRGSPQNSNRNFRIHPSRFKAMKLLKNEHLLDQDSWTALLEYLLEYREDTENRVIVLINKKTADLKLLHYTHRFQPHRLKETRQKLYSAFKLASKKYKDAVFLTVTMDPASYSNLWEATRRIFIALDRFINFLNMRRKRQNLPPLDYIAVLEAQEKGNPHLHIVIFGIRGIMNHFKLTGFLIAQGFGMIHYEYALRYDPKKGWVWARKKPKGSNSKTAEEYLSKYLSKAFYSEKLAYYFASNKRFFTTSRSLNLSSPKEYLGEWKFLGSWHWTDVPEWILAYAGVLFIHPTDHSWRAEYFKPPPYS